MHIKRLLQAFGFRHISVQRAVIKRVNALGFSLRVFVYDKVHARVSRRFFAQRIHVFELPGGIDMQERKRRGGRIKGFFCDMQHSLAIFANAVEHDRIFGFGRHFAHNVYAFGFQPL